MFGSKLRSWMEAVRPRKKHNRKDKNAKANPKKTFWDNDKSPRNLHNDIIPEDAPTKFQKIIAQAPSGSGVVNSGSSHHSRYSAHNLSSPESAYSTGYSTDGTSPGTGVPSDYLANNKTLEITYYSAETATDKKSVPMTLKSVVNTRPEMSKTITNGNPKTPVLTKKRNPSINMMKCVLHAFDVRKANSCNGELSQNQEEAKVLAAQARSAILVGGSPALGLTSPRQRNRIRTNPWLGSATSPAPVRQEYSNLNLNPPRTPLIGMESPLPRRFINTVMARKSLSSSSCSSLSGSLRWDMYRTKSQSDDDCTLNEMMGKYDESYVYEKETDILSDSDPTDCETDIDTGQDGGDEDDPQELELDFIDNGSYLEFDPRIERNTGHCSYYSFDVAKKCSSRRRNTRKSKQSSEKKKRSSSNKRRHKQSVRENYPKMHLEGSKSAGATPVSVRRASQRPLSKLALEDCLKRRSNSISFCRDPITTIDKRDKEADKKYKELIVEAEHILRTMKSNGLSPRRVPGPANKRVELLRTTECAKPDMFIKAKASEETVFSKIPSSNFNCPRFSPKKNHITNFIINNSPILVRREWEMQAQAQAHSSPLVNRKKQDNDEVTPHSKSVVFKETLDARRSPKYRKKAIKHNQRNFSSSSEDENEGRKSRVSFRSRDHSCPQSEPMRRKVYAGYEKTYTHCPSTKAVTFNLNVDKRARDIQISSSENLRHHVLLNTIASLKRNLEDQSASLKQVYGAQNPRD